MTTSLQATPRTTHTAPTFAASVWLVASREILARMRSKSFVISTAILLLLTLASVVAGGIFANSQADPGASTDAPLAASPVDVVTVAAAGAAGAALSSAGAVLDQGEEFEMLPVVDRAAAEALVQSGDVSAAIVPVEGAASAYDVTVIALDEVPDGLIDALSTRPQVELLNIEDSGTGIAYLVAIGFGIVFLLSASTFGSTISQSVVEEKQTRVVEILMTTIPVKALLAGKVVGNSVMALGQVVAIAALVVIGTLVTGQEAILGFVGPSIGWFVVFFAFGFVMLAALFAAASSMVSRTEDIASTTTPVTMLVMIPYFLVIFFFDNSLVLKIMSYVPFSAPVGMPVRVFLGEAAWWEPLASLAILIVSTVAVITLGSRIYRNSLLRMGARVPLRQALRG